MCERSRGAQQTSIQCKEILNRALASYEPFLKLLHRAHKFKLSAMKGSSMHGVWKMYIDIRNGDTIDDTELKCPSAESRILYSV